MAEWMARIAFRRKWIWILSSSDFQHKQSVRNRKRLANWKRFSSKESFLQLHSDVLSRAKIFHSCFTSDRYIFHEHWPISFDRCQSRLQWIYNKTSFSITSRNFPWRWNRSSSCCSPSCCFGTPVSDSWWYDGQDRYSTSNPVRLRRREREG